MSIVTEWDNIAEARLNDRLSGNDSSYNNIFLPMVLDFIGKHATAMNILDFGCGTGELTFEIAKKNISVIGLDISAHSIELAKRKFRHEKLYYVNKSIQELGYINCFDLVISSMSLMDTEDLFDNLKAINNSLKYNGYFLVIITHPCYWPIYWEYFNDSDFKYDVECKITRVYKTSRKTFTGLETTHFHRPINQYYKEFNNAGFSLIDIKEMRNPLDTAWYPRFISFELNKIREEESLL
jgi:ubiquinone/menaquinone biosynthesis C-methylase UbiE